jgi:anti-sigma B factor antagonist
VALDLTSTLGWEEEPLYPRGPALAERNSLTMSGLELDVLRAGDQAVVGARGAIDISTARELRERLVGLVSEGVRDLVVNLEGTSYIDAAGVDVIVRAYKLLSAHEGSFALVCPHDHLRKMFEVSDLSDVLDIYESVEEATARR